MITTKAPVDMEYDFQVGIGPNGHGSIDYKSSAIQALNPIVSAYAAANNGQEPTELSHYNRMHRRRDQLQSAALPGRSGSDLPALCTACMGRHHRTNLMKLTNMFCEKTRPVKILAQASKSARGLAQSKTWRNLRELRYARSVLDCGCPSLILTGKNLTSHQNPTVPTPAAPVRGSLALMEDVPRRGSQTRDPGLNAGNPYRIALARDGVGTRAEPRRI